MGSEDSILTGSFKRLHFGNVYKILKTENIVENFSSSGSSNLGDSMGSIWKTIR